MSFKKYFIEIVRNEYQREKLFTYAGAGTHAKEVNAAKTRDFIQL